MRESDATRKQPRISVAVPFYYGWVVVGLSFLANLMAAGIRSAPTVLIHPLEAEFGWSRTAIASAASLNLLLYGLAAPAGGWLIDRIGPRRVIDRKSTRLNSSHITISYAVFCLKKKKNTAISP